MGPQRSSRSTLGGEVIDPGDETELQILRQRKVNDRDTRLLRRRVVLRLDAEGKTTGETAEAVGISRTGKPHCLRI